MDGDPYRLLITHAQSWAAKSHRPLDADLLETALSLRDAHDKRPGTSWPAGSVAELMTVRWPGHGPLDAPDVDALVATLETFWRFLRATGRMASGSADPKDLTKEARRSVAPMRDRLADPAAHGAAKSLLAYGREIGISLDEADSVEEANARFAAVAEAWNALPQEERFARSPGPAGAGSQASAELTATANHLLGGIDLNAYAQANGMLEDDEDDDAIPPQDPGVVAAQFRASGFFARLQSLVNWVGSSGRPVTQTGVLRPAVAREAIADLGLDDWMRTELGRMPGSWRSAADHLGLDRLYLAATDLGLIELTGTMVVASTELPRGAEEWADAAIDALIAAYDRGQQDRSGDPLLGMLLALAFGDYRTREDLVAWWQQSPANTPVGIAKRVGLENLPEQWHTRVARISEDDVTWTLAYWRDAGILTERRGRYAVTELGLDFARILIVITEVATH